MNNQAIWLIHVSSNDTLGLISHPPLGIATIASSILESGRKVQCFDLNISYDYITLFENINNLIIPNIVGISFSTESTNYAIYLARIIKASCPSVTIIGGGPHATFDYKNLISNNDFDIVVLYRGEKTILKVIEALEDNYSIETIANIAGKNKKKYFINIDKNEKFNFQPPIPTRSIFRNDEYKKRNSNIAVVVSSIGCKGNCYFCSASAFCRGKVVYRNIDDVFCEIDGINKQYGTTFFFFGDDNITEDLERFKVICMKFSKRSFFWGCEAQIRKLDSDILNSMRESGCILIQSGIERVNNPNKFELKKSCNAEHILDVASHCKKIGIDFLAGFMMPLPGDTLESININKEFGIKLSKIGSILQISATVAFPGTKIYKYTQKYGIKIIGKNWEDFSFKMPHLTVNGLKINEVRKLFFSIAYDFHKANSKNTKNYFCNRV